ncbi:MAG: Thioredoxin reductase [bacterium ADurb.Bin400]|nr:MAG: Thioredoxin reductase [bacterium ADurb.Bin400]
MYDTIVIGAGPAGLTAAIYASRRAMKVLVISGDIGGQITKTYDIENYPGFEHISGAELALKFRHQAEKFGAEIILDSATSITPQEQHFIVKTDRTEYRARSIILAFGKKPRELNVPGESKLKGHGVTYCATCDAPFFKAKDVAVVGGGNSAIDAALLASRISDTVYLIHRGSVLTGEQYLIDKIKESPNIKTIFNAEVSEIAGKSHVDGLVLKDGTQLSVSGVMIEVGYIVDRSLVEGLVELDKRNQIIVNGQQETSVPGIFAAGDLTPTPYKQIVISASEGAKAALACFDFIQRQQGRRGIIADWH